MIGVDSAAKSYPTPVAVPGLSSPQAISAGYSSTCAVTSDTSVKCWGLNNFGQVAVPIRARTPQDVVGLP